MVHNLVLKRLYNLPDEQMEYRLLDCMSYKRSCGLVQATNIPDWATVWVIESWVGVAGAQAIFDGVAMHLLKKGFIAQSGQIIDVTQISASRQHLARDDKEQIKEDTMSADWALAKRRQKDLDATWAKKYDKSHHGHKFSLNVDKQHTFIRKIVTDTTSTHEDQHSEVAMDQANTSRDAYAGRGYPSAEREARLKAKGYRNWIQSKGHLDKLFLSRNRGETIESRRLAYGWDTRLRSLSRWVAC